MKQNSNAKNIKKWLARLLFYLVVTLVALPLAITVLFRSPLIQTYSARIITDYISEKIDGKLEINSVKLSFFEGIRVRGLVLYDKNNLDILSVDELNALPEFPWISSVNFNRVDIKSASFTLGKYNGDNNFAFLQILHDALNKVETKDSIHQKNNGSTLFKLKIKELMISNSRFRFFDENYGYDKTDGMQYDNLIFDSINGFMEKFYLEGDSLSTHIALLNTRERGGLKVENIKGDYIICSHLMRVKNAVLRTPKSNLDFDLDFNYGTYRTMSYFVDSVIMVVDFRPSVLNMGELVTFHPIMGELTNEVNFSGSASGPVRELSADNLNISFGNSSSLLCDAYIRGLPDFYNSYMRLGIQQMKMSLDDLEHFSIPIEGNFLNLPFEKIKHKVFDLSGNFNGYYSDFKSNLQLNNDDSQINTSIEFLQKPNDSLFIQSFVKLNNLDLSDFTDSELIKNTSLNARINIEGLYPDNLQYAFDGLMDETNLMGNEINRAKFTGTYIDDRLKSDFIVGDKKLMAKGDFLLIASQTPELFLNSDIERFNLFEFGFWNSKLTYKGGFNFKLKQFDIDDINLTAELVKPKLSFANKAYISDSAKLSVNSNNSDITQILFNSRYFDLIMDGKYNPSSVGNSIIASLNSYYHFTNDSVISVADSNFNLRVNVKDQSLIGEQIIKGIEFSKGGSLNVTADIDNSNIDLTADIPELNLYGTVLYNNTINVSAPQKSLKLNFISQSVIFKDSSTRDTTVLGLDNLKLKSQMESDNLSFSMNWDNQNENLKNKGTITGKSIFNGNHQLSFNSNNMFVNNNLWEITNNNKIIIDDDGLEVYNLGINASNSSMLFDGRLKGSESDTLSVNFDNWNISYLDMITKPFQIDADGIIDGYLNLGVIESNPTIISNIRIQDFTFNNIFLGDAHLLNTWDNTTKSVYMKAQILDKRDAEWNEILNLSGYYFPFSKDSSLRLNATYNHFSLGTIEPFLSSYIRDVKGYTSGEISLRGTIDKPILTGFSKINESSLVINYLNTRYSFSNIIVYEKDLLHFDRLVVFDTLGNQATIHGYMKHNYFKNPQLNVDINTDKLLFFNTNRRQNDLYYGSGILSGDIKISGSPDDIKLAINTSTLEGTRVFLPLDFGMEVSDKDYIVFIDNEADSLFYADTLNIEKAENDDLNYDIDLGMKINPSARINIAMPSNMGDILAQGNGDLNMNFNSGGDFDLVGEYVVERGLFNFTIENLVNKRFELVPGGRISWTGDPYTANINLKGLYKVKANLSSLGVVIDSSASYKNKVNVECYIKLTNKLLNPEIKFQIEMPDLDPDLQRVVYSNLDTTNVAMMNQQMISLLVLGTFSYSNASNYNLSSSYYTILTNQLSSMLSRISDDFDIGVNYKPGDNISNEEFEVALSTQLFDDRLIIDGNFGLTYDRSGQNASNIVGDVDIAYKLTEDGRWILKAYNHSNVNSWYYYNNYDKVSPYTQGVGVAFVKEFNKFGELFRRKKRNKK